MVFSVVSMINSNGGVVPSATISSCQVAFEDGRIISDPDTFFLRIEDCGYSLEQELLDFDGV
jgi:hypothetical protein